MPIIRAYEQGRSSAQRHLTKDQNPYDQGTIEYEDWLEGWQDYFVPTQDSRGDTAEPTQPQPTPTT